MKQARSLTEGTPWKLLVVFAIPLLIGQLFQLLYSIVDVKIVGMALGDLALASVGSVSTIFNLLNVFANGLTMGFSIILAMHFGAKAYDKVKDTFAQSIVLCLVIIGVFVVLVTVFLRPILHVMHVPAEQFEVALSYIRVLTIGMIVTVMYHMCAHGLRAIGDSVTPLIYLIIASVTNIILDLLFVVVFGMGVAGAAYATVIAQLFSVVLCLLRIFRKFPLLHVSRNNFRYDRQNVREMLKSGISMGLTSSIVAIGTVILQAPINELGTSIIVAHTAARKMVEILNLPNAVISWALAAYTGQNYGAKKYRRIQQGMVSGMALGAAINVILLLITVTCSKLLIHFIASTDTVEIITWGARYITLWVACSYICFTVVILRSCMQGFGNRIMPVWSSVIELVGKVVFALALVPMFGYWAVIVSEPIIWALMLIPLAITTRKFFKEYIH